MPIALLLALQVAPITGEPPARIDLLPATAAAACPTDTDDVVVCGRRDPDRFRLRPLPDRPDGKPIRAETTIAGQLKASATVEQAEMPNGQVSNRAMVNLKLKF